MSLKARDGARYVANVLPLTSGARRNAGAVYSATAVVFVHRATLDMPSPPEALAREFRLTPAELRVLFAIIEVGNASEVAEVLGISLATAERHWTFARTWLFAELSEATGTDREL